MKQSRRATAICHGFAAIVLAAAFTAPPAAAQTLAAHVDKSTLALAGNAWVWPAELDGDPDTREWVQYQADSPWLRAVLAKDGRICTGAWFNPWTAIPEAAAEMMIGGVLRVGAVDRFVAQGAMTYAEVTIRPECWVPTGQRR